ncbi:MAG: hypothetical protein RR565_07455 [Erysipelothrix sp.]
MSLILFNLPLVLLLGFLFLVWVYQSKALTFNARNALKKDPKRKFVFSKTGFIIVLSSTFITLSCVSVYSIYLYNVHTIVTRCVTPAYDSQIPELKLCANQFGREIFTDTTQAYSVLNSKYQDEIPVKNVEVTPKSIRNIRYLGNPYLNKTYNYITDLLLNSYDFHTNVMESNPNGTYLIDGVWLLQFKTTTHNLNSSNVTFTITNLTSSPQTLSPVYPILFMDGDFGVDPNLLHELNTVFEPESLKQFNMNVPHTKTLTIKINTENVSYFHQGGPQ